MRISMDGPSGAGKTTTGTLVAMHYGLRLLDTGLTFRAVAFARNLQPNKFLPAQDVLRRIEHRPATAEQPEQVLHDGSTINGYLFDPTLDHLISELAKSTHEKANIADYHRSIVESSDSGILAVGRDAATRLFDNPQDINVYLTADPPTRQARREAQALGQVGRSTLVRPESQNDLTVRSIVDRRRRGLSLDNTHKPTELVTSLVISWIDLVAADG